MIQFSEPWFLFIFKIYIEYNNAQLNLTPPGSLKELKKIMSRVYWHSTNYMEQVPKKDSHYYKMLLLPWADDEDK